MKKQIPALAAALCLTVSTLAASANAASCFPRYTGTSVSVAAALDALGVDSSYANRADIAAANGISGYRGAAAQNIQMLELLRQGALIDPAASGSPHFPAYTGSSPSIAAALAAVGAESSFSYRAQIAAANGVANYSGTAAQNTSLLQLLKEGRLVKPDSASLPAPYNSLTAANLSKVPFIPQDKNTCKATAAAMAVNLVVGGNRYSTSSMIDSGVLCRNLNGALYKGSNGSTYRTTYKTDSYAGSLSELKAAVEAAVSSGLPIVVPVHSSSTRHHFIVFGGRDSSGKYLAVDPAASGSGSMSAKARSMASMGYSFGLTDYAAPHYGYISFQRTG